MSDEPTHTEVHDEDNLPATKGDVRNSQEELARMMASSFTTVATKDDLRAFATKDDLTAMERRLEQKFATKDQVANVLNIVNSINEQLKEWKAIPAKVERLHRAVFPHR